MLDEKLLKEDELYVTKLRSIYEQYGYKPYKMSKFEEYELYISNKDFLVSDRIITFNDTNGKLLALKPDVTLSIIKNLQDVGEKQKLYYNENVYRVSKSTDCFKEIMQVGLECVGDISVYDVFEVIMLSAKSLNEINKNFVLEISNLSLIESIIKKANSSEIFKEKAFKLIESKNSHDLIELCNDFGVDKKNIENILMLINLYGERNSVIKSLKKNFNDSEISDIIELSSLLDLLPFSNNIIFNFSVSGNTNYYNGFVFHGFIQGINERVLAGGQYDKMMAKLSKKMGAIGFAVYLDLLEQLSKSQDNDNIDVLILYDDKTVKSNIVKTLKKTTNDGKKILVSKESKQKTIYKELIDLRGEKNA